MEQSGYGHTTCRLTQPCKYFSPGLESICRVSSTLSFPAACDRRDASRYNTSDTLPLIAIRGSMYV